jgi:hypothetical protein
VNKSVATYATKSPDQPFLATPMKTKDCKTWKLLSRTPP